MSSKLATYANLIVRYENQLKDTEKRTAEDGKKIVLMAENLSSQFRNVAEQVVSQIFTEIDQTYSSQIQQLSKKYFEEREKEIEKIKKQAQKNVNKAVDFVIAKLLEVYK
ncbi:hypothetical protein [Stygiolobus caldivivus]|uniref:Uncharacterized protein n=1 Tax=Stygiolobus caldivivus TaxID=2824673 RepID=A0A8D5U7M4_9CREN|nr:hypothetical protein [Stygiolobus caldivivus]BCU70707.1 hypothetical protein KN1_20040 [Stygiolobus caldivivus]